MEDIKLGVVEIENSYSGNGWKGVNCDLRLSTKEIANLVKKKLKNKFPTATFSVTSGGNWSYSEITIKLMKDSNNPFNTFEDAVYEAEHSSHFTGIIGDYSKWSGLTEKEIQDSEIRKMIGDIKWMN